MKKSMKTTFGALALAAGLTANAAWAQSYTAVALDPVSIRGDRSSDTGGNTLNDSGWVAGITGAVHSGFRGAMYVHPTDSPIIHINYSLTAPDMDTRQSTVIYAINQGALGVGRVGNFLTPWDEGEDRGWQRLSNFIHTDDAYHSYEHHHTQAAWFSYDGRGGLMGTLPGATSSIAVAVNDAGWAVGHSWANDLGESTVIRPFVWIPRPYDIAHGVMLELPCPLTARIGEATSINNGGLIGGHCDGAPYLWWNGVGYDITSWLPEHIYKFFNLADGADAFTFDRSSPAAGRLACTVEAIANSYAYAVNCVYKDSSIYYMAFVSTPDEPELHQINYYYLDISDTYNLAYIYSINDRGCVVGSTTGWSPFKKCPGESVVVLDSTVGVPDDVRNPLTGFLYYHFSRPYGVPRSINNHDQILLERIVEDNRYDLLLTPSSSKP